MADEENLGLNEEEAADGADKKKKKGGSVKMAGLIPMLLKWGAIGIGAIILIVTVVIVTMRIMRGNASAQAVVPISQEYQGRREVLDWYQSIGTINSKTSDPIPASITVEPVLGYKQADKATSTEITSRQVEIKDFLRRYFAEKTAEDLKPYNEEKLAIEIRNSINDDILTTSKIRDVKFLKLDVVEQ
ncbi:MAG: flagellar basal body-associated FliL family protein [Spirochaetaceae bacterium]|jgi:flagellar FliL protein|nr:flagellar basal body-associated FliL family protein [Spirochaetaceae bacterium]